jgi:hypothetical protein
MASRKQQQTQARARRLAEEQARVERAHREHRLRMVGGVVVLAVAVAGVVIAISAGGGPGPTGYSTPIAAAVTHVALPGWRIRTLAVAATGAGCQIIDTADSIARTDENRLHVSPGTTVHYQTNPPSYGPHYPVPAHDGEYAPGRASSVGFLVHALEHGRIEYQYRPGLPAGELAQLEALFNETDRPWAGGQLLLLFQNTTAMRYDVAATAWGHLLGCPRFNPRVFDALRDFRVAYTDRGPEQYGTGPE